MVACRNILVATDFSPLSDLALLYGRELALMFGARLDVLHAVSDVVTASVMEPVYGVELTEAQKAIEDAAKDRLRRLLTDDGARWPATTTALVTCANPAAAILEYTKAHPIDLVILGSHGRSGLGHVFIGSVAEKVVRASPCPVLTVRLPERDFVKPDVLEATSALT